MIQTFLFVDREKARINAKTSAYLYEKQDIFIIDQPGLEKAYTIDIS